MGLIDLAALAKLEAEATPGPWFDLRGSLAFANEDETGGAQIGNGPNGALIAALRSAAPELLALAREALAARPVIDAVKYFAENSYDGVNGVLDAYGAFVDANSEGT